MRKLLLSLFTFLFVVYYTSKDVEAQTGGLLCMPKQEAENYARQNGQQLVFSGINLENVPFELWASDKTYTTFVLLPDGSACFSPSFIGYTLANNTGDPV
jgi:hypothetical protein